MLLPDFIQLTGLNIYSRVPTPIEFDESEIKYKDARFLIKNF
jgi:hypothetical protein